VLPKSTPTASSTVNVTLILLELAGVDAEVDANAAVVGSNQAETRNASIRNQILCLCLFFVSSIITSYFDGQTTSPSSSRLAHPVGTQKKLNRPVMSERMS